MNKTAVDHLKFIGFPFREDINYEEVIADGPINPCFTEIVSFLTLNISMLGVYVESRVFSIDDPQDSKSFLVELSSFLKEMKCPYTCLLKGPLTQRLASKHNKELLIQYLCLEMQAARLIRSNILALCAPKEESDVSKELKEVLICLGFCKPPPTVTSFQIFSKVEARIAGIIAKRPVPSPLFYGNLTEKQWFSLEELQIKMAGEYKTRRNMLIKRLDLTVQSFGWSNHLKVNITEEPGYSSRRDKMNVEPKVNLSDLLAARFDLLTIEKTSNERVRRGTSNKINKLMIGPVPDRGGRPEEQKPPPPELPSWMKRDVPPQSNNMGGARQKESRANENSLNRNRNGSYQVGNSDQSSGSNFGRGRGTNYVPRGSSNYYNRSSSYTTPTTYGGNYLFNPNQPPAQYNQAFMPPPSVHMFSPVEVYGLGMGGYAASGGNFQQFCESTTSSSEKVMQFHNKDGVYRSRGGRGGRPRGGRRGRPH